MWIALALQVRSSYLISWYEFAVLPVVTGAPCSASMAPSSSTLSTVTTHGRFPYLTPPTMHSSLSGILPSDMISSYSGLQEQPSGGSFSGLSLEATNCADLLGDGVQNNIGISNAESQQIPGFVRTIDESDDRDEWLTDLDDIITTDITPNCQQLVMYLKISNAICFPWSWKLKLALGFAWLYVAANHIFLEPLHVMFI